MITIMIMIILLPKSKKSINIFLKYIYIFLFIITKWILFHQCHLFTRSEKTLISYINSRNCKVSLFPRSGKHEVIFCIYWYIWFYFHEGQNIAQQLLFALSTNNYLIFLVALLYFTNAFYSHEVEKGKKALMIYLPSR